MSFPTRSAFQLAGASFLVAGALLHAQSSRAPAEAAVSMPPSAATELEGSALAADISTQPRTLASMASKLEPVVQVLTNVLNQYQKSGNRDGEANTLCALGNSYNSLGQQQKAIDEFQLALTIYRGAGDKRNEANTLSRIGDVYRSWGFPDIAVRFYRDALQLHSQISDKSGKAVLLNNLGVTYLSLSNKKKALDYLDQALAAFHDAGNRHAEILTLINIGAAENFLAYDTQKAISLFEQAIAELEPLNDRTNEADAFELLGVVWAGLHKQDTAETNFQRALALYRQAGNAKGEASVVKRLNDLHSHADLASIR